MKFDVVPSRVEVRRAIGERVGNIRGEPSSKVAEIKSPCSPLGSFNESIASIDDEAAGRLGVCRLVSGMRCHFCKPDRRFNSFDLAKELADAPALAFAPMLKKPSGFGSDLPLTRIR